jgi:hypothetical protein
MLPTSVVADKMAHENWSLVDALDNSESWVDVGGPPSSCAYSGGSVIRGPDGRLYAVTLVDPDGGPPFDGDLPNDPNDPGWAVVGRRVGTVDVGKPPSVLLRLAAFVAGTGGARQINSSAGPAAQDQIVFGPDGQVYLKGDPPQAAGGIPRGRNAPDLAAPPPMGDGSGRYVPRDPVGPSETGQRAGAALGLVTQAEQGVSLAQAIGDRRYAYQVVFAEAPDGRRRAYVKLFQVYRDDVNGGYSIYKSQGTIQPDGTVKNVSGGFKPIRVGGH